MKKLFTLLSTTLLLLFSSCGEEETYLNVYPSSDLHVSASGGEFSFNVDFKGYNDNDCIYVNCAESWVNVKDSFNHYFSLTIQPNPTSMERSAIVEVRDSAWNLSPVRFAIYQSAGPASENGNNNGNNSGNGGNNDTYVPAPTNLTASVSGYDITLYWNYSGVADYFHIYLSDYRDSGYEYLGYIDGNNLGVILEADVAGTYYFKVTAEKDGMESDYSNIASATISSSSGGNEPTPPSKPTNVRAVKQGETIEVTWNAASNATRYAVYYIPPYPYDIESFEWTVQTYMTFYPKTKEGTWTFWVVAVNDNYDRSDPSSRVTCYYQAGGSSSGGGGGSSTTTQLDTPTNLDYWSDLYYVQVSCDEVSLAYDYELYRSTSANYGYKKITASGGATASGRYVLTDSNPVSGTSYYKIKAIALPDSYGYNFTDSELSDYVKVVR